MLMLSDHSTRKQYNINLGGFKSEGDGIEKPSGGVSSELVSGGVSDHSLQSRTPPSQPGGCGSKDGKKMKSLFAPNSSATWPLRLSPFDGRVYSSNLVQPIRILNKLSYSTQRHHSRTIPMASSSSSTQSPAQGMASSAADANAGESDVFQLIQAHQEKAARLVPVDEIRTFLHHNTRGMLSTFSQKYEGYPSGSMVDFACDAEGSPILAVSSLAVHTKDLSVNPKCSLLVAKDPEDRTELVVTIHGDVITVSEEERETICAAYLAKHPSAFWVDFGDFHFVRIEPKVVRYVYGVATALLGSGEFSKEQYSAAKVDSIYQFSKPIASHMNKDHADETKLIVQHWTSIPVDFADILELDSLGFNVKAGCQGNKFKLRVPFPRPAADRKDVKNLIVEMLQAAKP